MSITKKTLIRHELIGLCVEVVLARNESNVGVKGKIIDETQKTLEIRVDKMRIKTIFKSGTIFRVTLPNEEKVEVVGDEIRGRPWERINK